MFLYMAIVSAGYIFGGLAAVIGWRSCFLIEAALGVPIVVVTLLAPDVELRSSSTASPAGRADAWQSLTHPNDHQRVGGVQ